MEAKRVFSFLPCFLFSLILVAFIFNITNGKNCFISQVKCETRFFSIESFFFKKLTFLPLFHSLLFLLSSSGNIKSKDYFAESINSDVGFYGRRCESYLGFVFGWCDDNLRRNISDTKRIKMGEHCEQK